MVAPSRLKVPASETQPAEPRRTRPSNATWQPGLPDKPAPRRTSAQKRADEEQVKDVKEAKASALNNAYQRIASLQVGMVKEQSNTQKNRAAVHPKPRVVKKDLQAELPVILGPHYPYLGKKTGLLNLHNVLAETTKEKLWEAASETRDRYLQPRVVQVDEAFTNTDGESDECPGPAKIKSCVGPDADNTDNGEEVIDSDDDSDERSFAWKHPKGLGIASRTQLVQVEEVPDLEPMPGTGQSETGQRRAEKCKLSLPREWEEPQAGPDSEPEMEDWMKVDPQPEAGGARLTSKTAVGVIEATPFKKMKTEATAKVTKTVTLANGNTHAVSASSRKGTSASKGKYTKNDLPRLMRDDSEDKWSKKVIPCLILWYRDQENIWSVGEEDLARVLAAIIKVVYPYFNKPDEFTYGSPIYGLAVQRLNCWRNIISNAACQIVANFLKLECSSDMTVEEYATSLLGGLAFTYEGFNNTSTDKAFQSVLLLNLFGSHLQQVYGWVDVPGLDLPEKCVHGVKGALALCTTALERAFKFTADGQLVHTITAKADREDHTMIDEETGETQAIELDMGSANGAAKESTKYAAFSHQNWGGQTEAYYKSISNRNLETIGDIVAGALCMLASSAEHLQFSGEDLAPLDGDP